MLTNATRKPYKCGKCGLEGHNRQSCGKTYSKKTALYRTIIPPSRQLPNRAPNTNFPQGFPSTDSSKVFPYNVAYPKWAKEDHRIMKENADNAPEEKYTSSTLKVLWKFWTQKKQNKEGQSPLERDAKVLSDFDKEYFFNAENYHIAQFLRSIALEEGKRTKQRPAETFFTGETVENFFSTYTDEEETPLTRYVENINSMRTSLIDELIYDPVILKQAQLGFARGHSPTWLLKELVSKGSPRTRQVALANYRTPEFVLQKALAGLRVEEIVKSQEKVEEALYTIGGIACNSYNTTPHMLNKVYNLAEEIYEKTKNEPYMGHFRGGAGKKAFLSKLGTMLIKNPRTSERLQTYIFKQDPIFLENTVLGNSPHVKLVERVFKKNPENNVLELSWNFNLPNGELLRMLKTVKVDNIQNPSVRNRVRDKIQRLENQKIH